MSRRTWKKGNLYVSFSEPSITPFRDGAEVKEMQEVMYFYYDVTILQHTKTMFKFSAYDFPKVQDLPAYIDHMMNFDMEKAYLLENVESDGFERKVRYHQITLEDAFQFNTEYFYKLERYDYSVKQSYEEVPKEWTEYTLTIGTLERSKKYGGDNREDYGKCLMIKYVTPEELTALKNTALEFCKAAIELHNKWEKEYQLEESGNK